MNGLTTLYAYGSEDVHAQHTRTASTTALHYTLLDALGSIRALVTPSGTVERTITYYPWGAAGDLRLDNPTRRSWLALVHRPNAVKRWSGSRGRGLLVLTPSLSRHPSPCARARGRTTILPIPVAIGRR